VDKHALIDFRLDTHTHFEDGVAYLSDGNVDAPLVYPPGGEPGDNRSCRDGSLSEAVSV
jgi:hypothetical protein